MKEFLRFAITIVKYSLIIVGAAAKVGYHYVVHKLELYINEQNRKRKFKKHTDTKPKIEDAEFYELKE